ncbi:hypothetical protein B0A48_17039 [Cryoendolithus antarcticus]|uniref:Uncharacterized protein n=1 Tax=Cryoendolithus antarcticus TaxID=1507870 RepID=A0A1V8SC31_9PEZI|nr:hypothetical protein B0A48_17039 [Cryoendolithus antarcticus]
MQGFRPLAHTAVKVAAANRPRNRKKIDDDLSAMIAELERLLTTEATPISQDLQDTLTSDDTIVLADYCRRVDLPATMQLNVAGVRVLNKMLAAEGGLLNSAQAQVVGRILDDGKSIGEAHQRETPQQIAHRLKLLQERVYCLTNQVARRTYSVADAGSSAQTVRVFLAEDEALLEDFFRVCRVPNNAEMEMLASFLQREIFEIYDWFAAKRTEAEAVQVRQARSIEITRQVHRAKVARLCATKTTPSFARQSAPSRAPQATSKKRKAAVSVDLAVEAMD